MAIEERGRTGAGAAVVVRDATRVDLPRVIALLDQLGAQPGQENVASPLNGAYGAAFNEIEADSRQRLFVLEADGVVVGTLVVLVLPNLGHRGRPYAIVENVVVDAAVRGSGYGERLMRHAIDEARSAGCYKITLTSALRRAEAHRFYERLGFQVRHKGFRLDL